jgi:hypothetical protein
VGKLAVAAVVLTALAVSGCSQNSPGVAAYIGDKEISDRQINEAHDAVNQAIGEQGPVARADVVTVMVLGEVSSQIAARKNIALSEAERVQRTDPTLLRAPAAREVAYDLADSNLVGEKLGPEAFLAEIKATPVTVNPRYGVWNPDTKGQSILESGAGSLSKPGAAGAQ